MSTDPGNFSWIFSARVVFPDPVPPAIPTNMGDFAKTEIETKTKTQKSF